jgi:hypothetical protein
LVSPSSIIEAILMAFEIDRPHHIRGVDLQAYFAPETRQG